MDKTGKSLGRILGQCQEQLIEGSKQGQRAQASIARLDDVICTIRELGPQAPAAESDVGIRDASRKLQVQALICSLQKLDIGSVDNTQGSELDRLAGHEIYIECHTVVVGAGCGETRGVGSSAASTDPSCASQNKPLTPSQSAVGYPKKNHNSRRRGRRGRDGDDQPPQRQNKPQLGLSNARLPFGCPFYFHDKEEHQNCLNYELKRIVDVRQHIYRFHVQPSYCPRCGILFQNDTDYTQRDTHERQRICEATGDIPRYSGATSDQLGSMSYAATHRCSSTDEERWYAIWDIMFPRIARPPSPYVDIRREWNRIVVHAAIAQYRQNGGPQDFIRQLGVDPIVPGILNYFLDHFGRHFGDYNTDYNRVTFVSAADPGNTYMITEAQSTIPIPSPSPRAQNRTLLVSQQTISPRVAPPVLLPQPPHIDSAHTGRTLPNLDPNRHPNTDVDDELGSFNDSYFNDNYFGDGYPRGGDSDGI
ncbi:hypothetical protein F5B21DRAFT_240005 [Xylaria acuta]|nr:hypothetical protein F5B21DRAFT_240005 [Xylaria acuta]